MICLSVSNPANFQSGISKKEFVFLHAFGDDSKGSFWPWLRKEIELRGGEVVFAPDLPNTNSPKLEEQAEYVLKNYKFNENTVVVAHSLGNILMMKLLERIDKKISKFIMVAPPLAKSTNELISGAAFLDKKSRPALAEYCDWRFDFKKIASKVGEIVILADERDHIVPVGQPKEIAEKLGAKLIVGRGAETHFNGVQEPQVLSVVLSLFS